MAFIDAFNELKKAFKSSKTDGIVSHLAIQVNLTDADSSGMCYVEVSGGKLFVEPYDYYDRDAAFNVTSKNLADIVTGKLDFDEAVKNGTLDIDGNYNKALEFKKLIAKPVKKAPAKKKAAKPAEKTVKQPTKCCGKTAAKGTDKIKTENPVKNPADKKTVSK